MGEGQASLLLKKQLKELSRNPLDGFSAGLVDDSNIFEWNVNYYRTPRYTVYIQMDEFAYQSFMHQEMIQMAMSWRSERWSPVHTVETILLSIISMLSSPNDESPANIDAAKEWREHKEEFKRKARRIVRKSQEMF